jgi:hypothetical protein
LASCAAASLSPSLRHAGATDTARALLPLDHPQQQLQDRLQEITPVSDADLRAAWEAAANPELARLLTEPARPGIVNVPEQWLVLVTCRDEKQQTELLERFHRERLECKALVG